MDDTFKAQNGKQTRGERCNTQKSNRTNFITNAVGLYLLHDYQKIQLCKGYINSIVKLPDLPIYWG